MGKIFRFVFFNIVLALPVFAAEAPVGPQLCELVEQALLYEITTVGQARTIENHIHIGKIYKALARRGCPENSTRYAVHSKASFEIARALIEIMDMSQEEKVRYNSAIFNAE